MIAPLNQQVYLAQINMCECNPGSSIGAGQACEYIHSTSYSVRVRVVVMGEPTDGRVLIQTACLRRRGRRSCSSWPCGASPRYIGYQRRGRRTGTVSPQAWEALTANPRGLCVHVVLRNSYLSSEISSRLNSDVRISHPRNGGSTGTVIDCASLGTLQVMFWRGDDGDDDDKAGPARGETSPRERHR
jgi:hypothetical protein